jgi:hypothetical protein
MLRPGFEPFWRRILAQATSRPGNAQIASRSCPECSTGYTEGDRYCPGCHIATPEWRYG